MSTVPDMRDIDMEIPYAHRLDNKAIGYLCATGIVIAMLLCDGLIALTVGGAVAGSMVGIEIGKRI